jgi:aminoglycoside phosphotransferase (APT) family kinase protein
MHRSIARSLETELLDACDGRLQDLCWVRMDWQRGGALTGTAWYETTNGPREAFVKFPVPGRELRWTRRLQQCGEPPIVPRLFASGDSLAHHDIGWLVMERIPGMPLGSRWATGHLRRTAEACASMQACMTGVPIDRPKRRDDWERWLEQASRSIIENELPEKRRWTEALGTARIHWEEIIGCWRARTPIHWIHGDLHLGNAMFRSDGETICLVDLAEVRPGHWIEDALYLERLYWSHPERILDENPLEAMQEARLALGLEVGEDVDSLANARRILLSATTPAFIAHEGTRAHLEASLSVLEKGLALWHRNGR